MNCLGAVKYRSVIKNTRTQLLLAFFLLICCFSIEAQPVVPNAFSKTAAQCSGFQLAIGTASNERAFDIVPTTNNEFITVGIKSQSGNDDILVTRIRFDKTIVWSKTIVLNRNESVRKIYPSSDGGVLIAGQTKSFNNINGDMLCLKISGSGALVWMKKFGVGSAAGDLAMDVIETSDEGTAISGILNVNGGVADGVVIKLDNAANIVWTKRFDRGDGEDGVGIVQNGDTLIVATDLQNGPGNYTMSLTKIKLTDGTVLMSRMLVPASRGIFNPYLYKNPVQPGYIISGHTIDGTSYANMKHVIISVDQNFNIISTKLISVTPVTNDFFTGLFPMSDGSFIACASPQSNADGYIFRINPDNSVIFSKRFNATSDRRLYRLTVSGQEIITVGGAIVNGQEDFFITNMKTDGTIGASCNVENVPITIQQPVYTSNPFSWPTITNVALSFTDIANPASDINLIVTDLCPGGTFDFSFQQNTCNPRNVQFNSVLNGIQSFRWDFGDGQTNSSNLSPLVTYQNEGLYNVKLSVQYAGGCFDSIQKTITIQNTFDNLLVKNNDTTICIGDSVLLKTMAGLYGFCWTTSQGPGLTTLNTFVKPDTTTKYILNAQQTGTNLVVNGDFSSGYSGFTSDFIYNNTSGLSPGVFNVGSNLTSWNPGMSPCHDHTSGNGQMLMVNDAYQAGIKVWSQTVSVLPNTNYLFSTWVQTISTSIPGQFQFAINGTPVGSVFSSNSQVCIWDRFFSTWNSGTATSAVISIMNMGQQATVNDYALDDIFFGTVKMITDSITINVTGLCDSIHIAGPSKVCNGNDILTYNIYHSPKCTQQYSFVVDNTFADIISQTAGSLQLKFKKNGTTSVKVAFANSCKNVVDSIDISIKFSPPVINFGPDINRCMDTSFVLNAGNGFASYQWQNGSMDSTMNVSNPGVYYVKAQNICGTVLSDTIVYNKISFTPFSASPLNASICKGDSVQFQASGGTSYSWSPASNFNHPNSSSPKATTDISQTFSVYINDSNCSRDTIINIPVIARATAGITLSKSNDVNCSNDSAILVASGGVNYSWSPNLFITSLNNGKITVKPSRTITYQVVGTDIAGCKGVDSVTVNFDLQGNQKLYMPTAFTPNGDGLNDVFKPVFIGPAVKYDFKIFNRWGQLVFRSVTPGVGWDGTFQSKAQPGDVFVYYITAEGGCKGKFVQKGTFALIR